MAQINLLPIADAKIRKNTPTTNYGYEPTLQCYYETTGVGVYRSVLSFDLKQIDGIISSIVLNLYRTGAGTSYKVSVHRLLTEFIENTVSWNVPWSTPGGDFDPVVIAEDQSPNLDWAKIPIPLSVVLPSNTLNLLLRCSGEGGTSNVGATFVSKDATAASPFAGADGFKPYIEVIYEGGISVTSVVAVPSEVEVNQQTLVKIDCTNNGSAGTAGTLIIDVDGTRYDSVPIIGMSTGQVISLSFPMAFAIAGTHTVRAYMLETGVGAGMQTSILVYVGPNLIVSSVYTAPDKPVANSSFELHAKVANTGDRVGSKDVTLSVDGSMSSVASVYSLNPGATTDVSVPFTAVASGNHQLCGDSVCITKYFLGVGAIEGYVFDNEDYLSGVAVAVDSLNTTTDSDGFFNLSGVVEGAKVVSFTKAGYNPKSVNVTVARDAVVHIDVLMVKEPPVIIKGTLVITTTPVAGEISVNGISQGTGSVSLELNPGSYAVSYGEVPGYTKPASVSAEVISSTTKSITGTYTTIEPEPKPLPLKEILLGGALGLIGVGALFSSKKKGWRRKKHG